jgi:hypothetical protein
MHVLLMRGKFYATPTCTGFPVLWQYKSCKESFNEKEPTGQQNGWSSTRQMDDFNPYVTRGKLGTWIHSVYPWLMSCITVEGCQLSDRRANKFVISVGNFTGSE